METGSIFDIQRFSIHDGPGIRTTVFLKGCSLSCFWCHNPESINFKNEILIYPAKCIGCGACIKACSQNAHAIIDGKKVFFRDKCISSGECVEVCYAGALEMSGRTETADGVVAVVERDSAFYETSDGGVTLSGGECLMQPEFTADILKKCKAKGFHTAVDTAGNVNWDAFEKVIPYTDLFLYDIKIMDQELHKKATGASNEKIIDNLKKLTAYSIPIWIRIPIIPDFNDSIDDQTAIADFVADLDNIEKVELLPFHRLGLGKYNAMGLEYEADGIKPPEENVMNELKLIYEDMGLNVHLG